MIFRAIQYAVIIAASLLGMFSLQANAQSEQELAKKSQNPVGNLISLPIETNYYADLGPTDTMAVGVIAKPVYPMSVGEFNLINRFIIPAWYVEGQDSYHLPPNHGIDLGDSDIYPGTSSESGLGNIQYQGFFSPAEPGRFVWGVGPVLELPTATNDALGTDTWSAGPAFLVLTMPGNWVVGALLQNIWDFAGDSDEPDINRMTFQPIINYNLSDGWYLSSVPIITADWEAASGEEWTVPLGGGAGRLVRFGQQAVDFRLTYYHYVEAPDSAPDWQLQLQVKWLFPKS